LKKRALTGLYNARPAWLQHAHAAVDGPTDRLARDLGFRIEHETTRFFGVFHLIVARPPTL
jgi:hypothetical protein